MHPHNYSMYSFPGKVSVLDPVLATCKEKLAPHSVGWSSHLHSPATLIEYVPRAKWWQNFLFGEKEVELISFCSGFYGGSKPRLIVHDRRVEQWISVEKLKVLCQKLEYHCAEQVLLECAYAV